MKKYLNLILLAVPAFFSLMVFVWMALPFLKETLFDNTVNGYKIMEEAGGIVVAFIFMILVLLISGCILALTCLKMDKKLSFLHFVALAGAILALIAMILFFLTETIYYDGETSKYVKLSAGAILSAVSALLSFASLGLYGTLKLLKK